MSASLECHPDDGSDLPVRGPDLVRLDLPRVDPVGIVERPESFEAAPRVYSPMARALALVVAAAFLVVSVGTTVYTLGVYCLTTFAGAAPPLPAP